MLKQKYFKDSDRYQSFSKEWVDVLNSRQQEWHLQKCAEIFIYSSDVNALIHKIGCKQLAHNWNVLIDSSKTVKAVLLDSVNKKLSNVVSLLVGMK